MTLTFLAAAAIGWAGGRHPVEQACLVATAASPVPLALILAVFTVRKLHGNRRPDARSASVLLLVRLASQLRSGLTLRAAIADVASSEPELAMAARLASAGRPMPDVVGALMPGLGRFGDITAAALKMASGSGGALAPVVEQLVIQSMALDDLDRERKAAMAPGLLQAGIVGGVPVLVLASMVVSGRFLTLLAAGPWEASMALTGLFLVATGIAVVGRIALRSHR